MARIKLFFTMRPMWKLTWTSMRLVFRNKGSFIGVMLFLAIMFCVEGAFWSMTSTNWGADVGYDSQSILLYVFTALTLSQVVAVQGRADQIPDDIESGRIDAELLRPVHPMFQYLYGHLGQSMGILACTLPVFIGLQWFLSRSFDGASMLMLLPLVIGASILNYCMNFFLSIFTFYWRESYGLIVTKETLSWVLSGALIPLDLLPSWLSEALVYSPFSYTVFFPVKVMTDSEVSFLGVMLMQGFMIASFMAVSVVFWNRSVRLHQAYGS